MQRKPHILRVALSAESLQARREWKNTFWVLSGSPVPPRLLDLRSISFKIDGKIKSHSEKQKHKTTQYYKGIFRKNVNVTYIVNNTTDKKKKKIGIINPNHLTKWQFISVKWERRSRVHHSVLSNSLRPHEPQHKKPPAGSQHTRSHPWQDHAEKTWQARQIRTSGIFKSCPSAHLKDDICLLDACYIRLFPNFCDTGRRPSPISFQSEST